MLAKCPQTEEGMFKDGLPVCPGKPLRVPQAADMRSNLDFRHEGVVVIRTGDSTGDTARLRTMYLYSPTIRYRSGKLVCSQDWHDYKLGMWIKFTVDEQERFFSNNLMKAKYETRLCPYDMATVQVRVRYFLAPDFISNTRCNGYSKVWSPELGPAFIRTHDVGKNGEKYKLLPDTIYRGWLSWGINQVNFDPCTVDAQDWPYEREALWEVSNDVTDLADREQLSDEEYRSEVDILRKAAQKESIEEQERLAQEKRMANLEEIDVSRDMIIPVRNNATPGAGNYNLMNHAIKSDFSKDHRHMSGHGNTSAGLFTRLLADRPEDDQPMILRGTSINFGSSGTTSVAQSPVTKTNIGERESSFRNAANVSSYSARKSPSSNLNTPICTNNYFGSNKLVSKDKARNERAENYNSMQVAQSEVDAKHKPTIKKGFPFMRK